MIARFIGIAVQVATVPLALGYLGTEKYGLWMAMASLIGFLHLSDLGVGNAAICLVASKKASGNDNELRDFLFYAIKFLSLVALAVFLIGTALVYFLDWTAIFNSRDTILRSDLNLGMMVLLGLFCVSLPLSIAQQARLGLQEGHKNAVFNSTGQLMNLGLLCVVISLELDLHWLIAASMTGTALMHLCNLVFLISRLEIHENAKQYLKSPHLPLLLKRGGAFFILQLTTLVSYQSDVVIVSHFLSPEFVSEYSVTLKYFTLPTMILSFFYVGMWPAYSDAFARNDKKWIVRFFWKSFRISLFVSISVAFVLFLFSGWFIPFWTKGAIVPGTKLVWGMMCWGVLTSLGGSLGTLLNGLGLLKFQNITMSIAAVCNISLSIFLVRKIGVSGPVWGSNIVLIFTYTALSVFIFRLLRNYEKDDQS